MRKGIALLLAVVMVFSLLGCGKNSSDSSSDNPEKVELTLAYPGNDSKREDLEKFLKKFEEKYPHIKVKLLFVPNNGWADYFNKLETMAAGGKAPDVIRVAIEGIQMFVKRGMALPLDEYMATNPDAIEQIDDIHPKLQAPAVIDGKTYGFAWDWNNVVIHFNTDLLKKAGLPLPPKDWTLDDFLRYARAMTTEEGGKKTYGFAIPNYYFGASAWLFNNEASVLNEDMTESRLDDPNAIEVIQLFHDLIYKYEVSPVPSPNTDSITQLMNGQVGMIAAGRWPFGSYEKNNFTSVDVQFLPVLKTQQVIFGFGIFAAMKATKHPKEAYLLSAFLSSADSQRELLHQDSIPARKSVMAEVLPNTPASNWKVFEESVELAKPVESPADYAGVSEIFDRYMSSVLSNQMDAATAMQKAKAEIDSLLAKSQYK